MNERVLFAHTQFQSQRDCVCQPRVARNELPWVGPGRSINPEGVEAPSLKHRRRSEQILVATPLGLIRLGTFSQGSSFLATVGFRPESLWDSRSFGCSSRKLLRNRVLPRGSWNAPGC